MAPVAEHTPPDDTDSASAEGRSFCFLDQLRPCTPECVAWRRPADGDLDPAQSCTPLYLGLRLVRSAEKLAKERLT